MQGEALVGVQEEPGADQAASRRIAAEAAEAVPRQTQASEAAEAAPYLAAQEVQRASGVEGSEAQEVAPFPCQAVQEAEAA